jgi:hypothetical protein
MVGISTPKKEQKMLAQDSFKKNNLALALFLFCCLVSCSNKNQTATKSNAEQDILQNFIEENGRYQMLLLPTSKQSDFQMEPQILILDSKKGLLWQYEISFSANRLFESIVRSGRIPPRDSQSRNRLEIKGFADIKDDFTLTKLIL